MVNVENIDNNIIVKAYFGDDSKINFKFFGELLDKNVDLDLLENKLNNLFGTIADYRLEDTLKYVTWLKTIFCDFDEKVLLFRLDIDEYNGCIVWYEKSKLIKYLKSNVIDDDILVKFNYNEELGFNISTSKLNDKDNNFDEVNFKIDKEFDNISKLKNIKPLELSYDGKLLSKMYKVFYGKDPDFSLGDTEVKTQIMAVLLGFEGISLSSNIYEFVVLGNNLVKSWKISDLLEELKVFGKIDVSSLDMEISDYVVGVIDAISEEIHKYFKYDISNLEDLKDFALLRTGVICNGSSSDINELVNRLGRDESDIRAKVRVLRKIDDRLLGK